MRGRLSKSSSVVRAARAVCAASLLLLSLTAAQASAAAAPLADYRGRINETMLAVTALSVTVEEAGEDETKAAEAYLKASVELRGLLPPTEQVESAGATFVVNNAWFHAQLDDYEKSFSRRTPEERVAALEGIADRLGALDARLAEAETAAQQSPPARDKDAEKGRLAAILRGKDYNRGAAEGGALQRLIDQILDAIASLFPDVRPVGPGARGAATFVQYAVFALALAVVAYFVRRYWLSRREQASAVAPREARVVLGERIEADRTASDLLTEAELLAREGDLRGAIRKAYVALLCELGDRKIVRLAHHKTNRDYLRDARRDAPPRVYEEMRPLTEGFERHWYGLEQADQSDWADYRTRCRETLRGL